MSPSMTTEPTTPIQTSLCRRYTTRDKRFVFSWPLPKHLHASVCPIDAGVRRTISGIRTEMNRRLMEGYRVACPITGHVLALYRRPLTETHVKMLSFLFAISLTKPGWHHYRAFSRGHSDGDLAKMRWWGLVESLDEVKDATAEDQRTGQWRITELGCQWLRGEAKIPRHQAIFRGEHLGAWDDQDLIGPQEVDERFSMDALTGAVGRTA